ncbi:helix-turn-helix domain-containing protein [Agromyces sp. SYSU K20354]|uniref:helix-turn-helix domain-containing protein n=1 Tax=Agromyces cavernae TaxID=2898659 RepID=UPI001E65B68C|nr:helix-turn-helix domain-containing protein [Agromyces cavernae]MCD2444329.1 helix-turn-helix domain-containing protein [Agromyces cavernae]
MWISGRPLVTSHLDALFEGLPETLTPGEVADVLRMTKPAVYKWLSAGTIPGYKLGGSWFVVRDELKASLEQGSNQPQTDTREG